MKNRHLIPSALVFVVSALPIAALASGTQPSPSAPEFSNVNVARSDDDSQLRPGQGAQEINASSTTGAIAFSEGTTTGSLSLGYGKYLSDSLVLDLTTSYAFASGSGATVSAVGLVAGLRYYLDGNRSKSSCPYVFGDIGEAFASGSDGSSSSASQADFGVGVDFFQTKAYSLYAQAMYETVSTDSLGGASGVILGFGVRLFLQK